MAATIPTRALADPAPNPESRHSVANQPNTAYAISDCSPKKSVIAQPSRVRAMSPKLTSRAGVSSASSCRTSPNQGTAATAPRTAHAPMPYRQLPNASATGTVSRNAEVRPTASMVV